ncbi:hypothetical protein ACFSKL_11965 [Belliella marina]|uniref:Uncharacterized protein n=1 Tax=Belliella marina TaxID=1644146 RepID=A0ABW4VM95_9BACT
MRQDLRKCLLVLLSIGWGATFYAIEAKAQVKEGNKTDIDFRRFILQDGKYVGGNIHQKNEVKKASVRKQTDKSGEMGGERFVIQRGRDLGAGSMYRNKKDIRMANQVKLEEDSVKSLTFPLRGAGKVDSISNRRIYLQEGSFIGVGPDMKKD